MNTDKFKAQAIAKDYAVQQTSKLSALIKLDQKAKRPAYIFAYTFGIISSLVLGTGMCFSLEKLGDGSTTSMIIGVAVGILGILGCVINYPIYKKLLAKGKAKYAFEIMELAKQIEEE